MSEAEKAASFDFVASLTFSELFSVLTTFEAVDSSNESVGSGLASLANAAREFFLLVLPVDLGFLAVFGPQDGLTSACFLF